MPTHRRPCCLSVIILALASLAPCAFAQSKLKLSYTETSMGKIPAGARDPIFSRDGKHVAMAVHSKTGWHIQLDGKPLKQYDWILQKTLAFSPDGSRLAYIVQKSNRMFLVVDETEGKEYCDIAQVAFSRDGKHLVYAAKLTPKSRLYSVILDGAEGKEYDSPRSFTFSRDGKRLAFAANAPGGKRRWIVDGVEGPAFEMLGPLAFSDDGSRFGYTGQRDGRYWVVMDGKEVKDYPHAGGIHFSPDGKRYAYVASRIAHVSRSTGGTDLKEQFFLVTDGVEGPAYDALGEPVFSPDGQHLACITIAGKFWTVIEDGKEHPRSYDKIGDLIYSDDSKHLIYRAMTDIRQRVIVDGKEGKEYDNVDRLHISSDGAHIAYAARTGAADMLVLDGKELPGAGNITMSPDGRFVAHCDDQLVDGKLLKTVIFVNDVKGNDYEGILLGSYWVFDANDRLCMMVGRDMEIIRVEVKISAE